MQMEFLYRVKRLVISDQAGKWCRIPYPNHKHGCPKYGDDGGACPPLAVPVGEVLNLDAPMYLVHSEFHLDWHVEAMEAKHPKWSDRQLRNVRHWQEKSRKQMRQRSAIAAGKTGANVILYCPEGRGVNVYATARIAGLHLERIRDLKTCRHVALLGFAL